MCLKKYYFYNQIIFLMKAMILAAGKGSRLKEITANIPKALVRIAGVPMIELQIKKLIYYGFDEIIINIHHYADQIVDFIKANNSYGIRIEFSHEKDELLETGGGLVKASWFFDDGKAFLIHNVDPLCNINLKDLYNYHLKNRPLVTLAVKDRPTSRSLIFNTANNLCGWEFPAENRLIKVREFTDNIYKIAFSCFHIIEPRIFPLITETGAFSLTMMYLRLAADHNIMAFRHDQDFWFDMGKSANLKKAEEFFMIRKTII